MSSEKQSVLWNILGVLFALPLIGFIPAAVGLVVGAVVGLLTQSFVWFWVAWIGVFIVGTILAAVSNILDGPSTRVEVGNPHAPGSTEWYVHENESQKYHGRT